MPEDSRYGKSVDLKNSRQGFGEYSLPPSAAKSFCRSTAMSAYRFPTSRDTTPDLPPANPPRPLSPGRYPEIPPLPDRHPRATGGLLTERAILGRPWVRSSCFQAVPRTSCSAIADLSDEPVSVVTPGSRTLRWTRRALTRSRRTLMRSGVAHARAEPALPGEAVHHDPGPRVVVVSGDLVAVTRPRPPTSRIFHASRVPPRARPRGRCRSRSP